MKKSMFIFQYLYVLCRGKKNLQMWSPRIGLVLIKYEVNSIGRWGDKKGVLGHRETCTEAVWLERA